MADIREEEMKDVSWKLGSFQFLFVSMGQGDCCIITCPDGKNILIDCGTTREETPLDEIYKVLRAPEVLGRHVPKEEYKTIDTLILTHPDKDHISQITNMLGKKDDLIKVRKVYFSESDRARPDFTKSPLRKYKTNNCNDTIQSDLDVTEINCITLNEDKKIRDYWVRDPDIKDANIYVYKTPVILTQASFPILKAGDDSWSVSIIAGGVKKEGDDKGDRDGRNAASLVTLVKFTNKKGETKRALICGDATSSTENYLINRLSSELTGIDLLQVPHHGSSVTSSIENFVNLIKPQQVIISVAKRDYSNHLPGEQTVNRYIKFSKRTDKERPVYYWQKMESSDYYKLKQEWEDSQKSGKMRYDVGQDSQKRDAAYVRNDVDDNFKGIIVLGSINTTGTQDKFVIYQQSIVQDINITGITSHLFYYFHPEGD